ncbi:GDSL-type esterase/lipase family protein [uncultured Maribacter sp.]|uniref:SGNH/GDSL hydrolase family protein n=1 Tax=uncultured Maribacter sp. TaxID=431308 RepID=UPI0030EBA691|tara:strand:- start:83910 stop:84944 length:1035 start_codon:yes stop_codon:yes gene_type:complete
MKIVNKLILIIAFAIVNLSTIYSQENIEAQKSDNEKLTEWKKVNEEAFNDTLENPFEKPNWGIYTKKDDIVYAHVYDWPSDGKLIIDRDMKVRTAYLDYGEKKLKTQLTDGNLIVFLPNEAPNEIATIVKIVLTPTEDWANLNRYRQANTQLKAPAKKEQRVVFIGNSITDNWTRDHGQFFEANPSYVNRGISGQTSAQMLLRFRPDVIELKPKVVVISAGTNDIAGNRGAIGIKRIAGNIFSMVELAKANKIKVVLASVLPASSYSWSPSVEPADKIIELNKLIKVYASENNVLYLDYYTPMVNKEKGLKKELGRDTVHPNERGYLLMEPLVKEAITKALKKK